MVRLVRSLGILQVRVAGVPEPGPPDRRPHEWSGRLHIVDGVCVKRRYFLDLRAVRLANPQSITISDRLNSVKTAFGGGAFTTQPAGCNLQPGIVGRDAASLDEIALSLTAGVAANSRLFSVGHDLKSTLDVYEQIGNVEEILTLVRDTKAGSLAMGAKQRHYMSSVLYKEKHPKGSPGATGVINATWMVDGPVFRKWVSTGTAVYDYKAYRADSYVPPRFYTQSGARVRLVEPAALLSGFKQAKVIGRLLPRFDAASPENIDLFAMMKLEASSIQVAASNPTTAVSWAESRLKEYPVTPALDVTKHQGIGMYVDGDGSGATLVVRLVCKTTARDYAVPLDFTGKQWVEIPSSEQGLRVANWGPVGKGGALWAGINMASCNGVAIGLGYLPANGVSNVTVSGLQALSEISQPLINPKITVGDVTVQAKGTLQAYDHFTLDPEGTFTIYDRAWNTLSNCSVGAFRPSNLAQFAMGPVAVAQSASLSQPFAAGGGGGGGSSAPWLEVGVAGATETVPNPAPEYTGRHAPRWEEPRSS